MIISSLIHLLPKHDSCLREVWADSRGLLTCMREAQHHHHSDHSPSQFRNISNSISRIFQLEPLPLLPVGCFLNDSQKKNKGQFSFLYKIFQFDSKKIGRVRCCHFRKRSYFFLTIFVVAQEFYLMTLNIWDLQPIGNLLTPSKKASNLLVFIWEW